MQSGCDRLVGADDADSRGWHVAGANELRYHAVDDVDRNREADAGIGAGRRDDRAIDPDYSAAGIKQRTARIAGIDRGIGLDDVGNLAARIGRQATLERADHAWGERLIQTERVTNRVSELADLEICRTADGNRRRKRAWIVKPDYRNVVIRRRADDLCATHRSGGQADRELYCTGDNVVVSDDITGLIPYEPRSRLHAAAFALLAR